MSIRRDAVERKTAILSCAVVLAKEIGYTHVSKDNLAPRAKCSPALIMYYFSTIKQLRRAVMGEAIRRNDLNLIAQGLINQDPRVQNLPEEVKRSALLQVLG